MNKGPVIKRQRTPSLPANKRRGKKTGVDDYVKAKGAKALAKKLKQAEAEPVVGGPIELESLNGANIEMKPIEYLWEPYLPKGCLSGMKGDPGGGKTFVALSIAALLSRGEVPASNRKCTPVNTLYFSYENDPARVIVPRYMAMGGVLARLEIITGAHGTDGKPRPFSLADVEAIEKAIVRTKAQFVVFDPLQSFLGAGVDMHRANETRPVLDGLAKVAERTNAAVTLVRHLAKSAAGRSVNSGLGSIDIVGAVRSEVLIGSSPTNRDECALIHDKPGICRRGDSLRFSIDKAVVKGSDGKPINTARVTWHGISYLTATDLRAPENAAKGVTHDARVWLRAALAKKPRLATELFAAWAAESGQVADTAERTMQKVAKDLKVKKHKEGSGKHGSMVWELPPPRKFEAGMGQAVTRRGRTPCG